jgi:ethanolamine utilization protein EutA
VFSGGVSEYIYGRETVEYGDLGPYLAASIKARLASLGDACPPIRESVQGIRATVIGASQYTVQVSGNTIYVPPREGLLPIRNLPVLRAHWHGETTSERVANGVRRAMNRFDIEDGAQPFALFVRWHDGPAYANLRAFADGLADALPRQLSNGQPMVLVFDSDIGGLVGNLLRHELKITGDVVSIDQVQLHDFDFIDIGEELPDQRAVPVVIKSLVFR